MQRSKIQTILENTSKSVFNVVTKLFHSGHKIHLTFDQWFPVDFLTADRQVAQFTEVLKTAQSQSVPRKFIPINKRPIPARILALIREKRRVYRSFIQTRDPALKTIFNRLNAQVRRDLNRFREEQWIDSCRLLDYRNGKKFWTQFQTLTGQKTTTVYHLVRNNAIINTPLEKANCFAETLEQINQVPNDSHFDDAFCAQVIRSVNNFRLTSLHRPTRWPPGACGLNPLDHAVAVDDARTTGTQDIYAGKPF
jgi:hypothetical protein